MKKILFSLFIVAAIFCSTTILAQTQIFIKAVGSTGAGSAVGTFDGGSTNEAHRNEIEALAYSDGLAGCENAAKGGGAGACKVSKTPFTFSMLSSFAVISFKYNLLMGKVLTSVDMVITKSSGGEGRGGFEFYKVHMENVLISSISEGGSSGDNNTPTFNIELLPQRIAWQITKQSNDGAIGPKFSTGWDFASNKAFTYSFPSSPSGSF